MSEADYVYLGEVLLQIPNFYTLYPTKERMRHALLKVTAPSTEFGYVSDLHADIYQAIRNHTVRRWVQHHLSTLTYDYVRMHGTT